MKLQQHDIETKRRLRRKNIALFMGLLILCIIFYGLALIRFKHTLG